jgi:hypothetical protein
MFKPLRELFVFVSAMSVFCGDEMKTFDESSMAFAADQEHGENVTGWEI